jgi:Transglutaminase-like superfamily
MNRIRAGRVVLAALFELIRYDVVHTWLERPVLRLPAPSLLSPADPELERRVCDAVLTATCLYWKPVLCLQHAVCVARLLRAHGVCARLVIGYRAVPFFSHAWVEVDGRVVNDSTAYRSRLQVLHTV